MEPKNWEYLELTFSFSISCFTWTSERGDGPYLVRHATCFSFLPLSASSEDRSIFKYEVSTSSKVRSTLILTRDPGSVTSEFHASLTPHMTTAQCVGLLFASESLDMNLFLTTYWKWGAYVTHRYIINRVEKLIDWKIVLLNHILPVPINQLAWHVKIGGGWQ